MLSMLARLRLRKRGKIENYPQWFTPVPAWLRELFFRQCTYRCALSGHRPRSGWRATVTFEPRARTAWHTHPLGQTLIVTQGRGWLQEWGGDIQEINQGDIVWIPEGVKHWHGATAQTAMTHIAIAESLNGSPVDWLEKVSDEQYENGK